MINNNYIIRVDSPTYGKLVGYREIAIAYGLKECQVRKIKEDNNDKLIKGIDFITANYNLTAMKEHNLMPWSVLFTESGLIKIENFINNKSFNYVEAPNIIDGTSEDYRRTEILTKNGVRVKIAKILKTSRPTVCSALSGDLPHTELRKKIRELAIELGGVEIIN